MSVTLVSALALTLQNAASVGAVVTQPSRQSPVPVPVHRAVNVKTGGQTSLPLGSPRLNGENAAAAAADSIDLKARQQFGGLYAGETITNNGRGIQVYLTNLNAEAEAALRAGAPSESVSFALAPRSLSDLQALDDIVISHHTALEAAGINIIENGINFTTGREDITVQNLTPTKTATLNALLGAGNTTLTSSTEPVLAHTSYTRAADTSPWNGGDFIYDDPITGACTSGFGAYTGTTLYEITAGHCFHSDGTGIQIINGNPNGTGSYYGYGNVTSFGNFGTSGGLDAEIIATNNWGGSSKQVFTGAGGTSTPQVANVSGTLGSIVGGQVCQDGAFEGEICGLVVSNPSGNCITEGDGGTTYYQCHVYAATNPSGGIAVGQGDSGGPVFRFSGSNLEAVGIVTAEGGTQTACPYEPTWFTGRTCGSVLYYTDINSVLSEFGLKIKTT